MSEWIKRLRAKIGTELTFVTSAGAWIENDSGHVLLQRRTPSGEIWGLPGGIMELGEASHETVIREVREETGLEVEIIALIGVYTKYFETISNGDQCQCLSIIYQARAIGGELKIDGEETFELRYFPKFAMPVLHSAMHRQIAADVLSGPGPFFH